MVSLLSPPAPERVEAAHCRTLRRLSVAFVFRIPKRLVRGMHHPRTDGSDHVMRARELCYAHRAAFIGPVASVGKRPTIGPGLQSELM